MQALPPRLVAPGGACKAMASAADTGDKRVLIVDDSKFVRTTFNRILSASFSVVEAVDGDAAWKAIQSDAAIAMVFSDLDMPKLDGYGLLRLVRGSSDERIKKLPVVVISGSQDKGAQSRARQAGANDFISKSAEAPDVLARIEHLLDKRPSALSGGDMQRIAIGRALVRRPKAMLMDEPIGALDAKLREEMRAELKHIHLQNEATTVYVTHDQVEAMALGQRVALMNDGVIEQVDTPKALRARPATPFVAGFLDSSPL